MVDTNTATIAAAAALGYPDVAVVLNNPATADPVLAINLSGVTKLTSFNYVAWCAQVRSLLKGYQLRRFIDESHVPPSPSITVEEAPKLNPFYESWSRQDNLLFSALLSSLFGSVQTLVALTSTSFEVWQTFAKTYSNPSRGHVRQLKYQINGCSKGNLFIDEYMQSISSKADSLALLGKPMDADDLVEHVLSGLLDEYKATVEAINAGDITISFAELHDKLINRQSQILVGSEAILTSGFPIIAKAAAFNPRSQWRAFV